MHAAYSDPVRKKDVAFTALDTQCSNVAVPVAAIKRLILHAFTHHQRNTTPRIATFCQPCPTGGDVAWILRLLVQRKTINSRLYSGKQLSQPIASTLIHSPPIIVLK